MKKNFYLKTIDVLRSIYSSDYYIVLLATMVLVGWITGFWVEFILAMLVLTIIGTIVSPSLKHVLSFLILYNETMSKQDVSNSDVILFLTFGVMEAIALIGNLIIYKKSPSVLKPDKIKGFTFAHILLVIPFLFAGVGYNGNDKKASLIAAGIIILITLLYLVLYVGCSKSQSKDFMNYILKSVCALSVVAVIELLIYLLRLGSIDAIVTALQQKNIWIGWTGPNTIASVISMGLPCTLYFCIKKRKLSFLIVPLCVIVFFIELTLVIFSGSRGATLFSLIVAPSALLYVMWKTENKTLYFFSCTVTFVAIALLFINFNDSILNLLSTMIDKGMSSSHRLDSIYPEAVGMFKVNPIFGIGWGYRLTHNLAGIWQPYFFHSTFFQFLANMGIVGVIFMTVFLLWRYFLLLPMYKNPAAVLITVSILLFDMYSMIDTSFFNPALFIVLDVMSLSMELDMPENRCLAFLGKNPFKFIENFVKNK